MIEDRLPDKVQGQPLTYQEYQNYRDEIWRRYRRNNRWAYGALLAGIVSVIPIGGFGIYRSNEVKPKEKPAIVETYDSANATRAELQRRIELLKRAKKDIYYIPSGLDSDLRDVFTNVDTLQINKLEKIVVAVENDIKGMELDEEKGAIIKDYNERVEASSRFVMHYLFGIIATLASSVVVFGVIDTLNSRKEDKELERLEEKYRTSINQSISTG